MTVLLGSCPRHLSDRARLLLLLMMHWLRQVAQLGAHRKDAQLLLCGPVLQCKVRLTFSNLALCVQQMSDRHMLMLSQILYPQVALMKK